MKILVCDDDQQYVDTIMKYLEFYKGKNVEHYVKGISDVDKLLIEIKINKYDLVYLDVELGKVNGIDIAHYLLEQNSQCIIVFVTGYYQYIHQSFKLRICNFIHKPFEDREFELVYYQALELYQRRNSTFTFNTSKGKQIFNPFDILYIETYYNSLKIVTNDKSYYSNIKNSKVIKSSLKPFDFMQIHQSIFVNFHFVDRIHNDTVIMKNTQEFPISLNKKQEIITAFNKFIMRR